MSEHVRPGNLIDQVAHTLCSHEHGVAAFEVSARLRSVYRDLARTVIAQVHEHGESVTIHDPEPSTSSPSVTGNDSATHDRLGQALDRVEDAMYRMEEAERTGNLPKTVVSEGVWTALSALHNTLHIVRSRL